MRSPLYLHIYGIDHSIDIDYSCIHDLYFCQDRGLTRYEASYAYLKICITEWLTLYIGIMITIILDAKLDHDCN